MHVMHLQRRQRDECGAVREGLGGSCRAQLFRIAPAGLHSLSFNAPRAAVKHVALVVNGTNLTGSGVSESARRSQNRDSGEAGDAGRATVSAHEGSEGSSLTLSDGCKFYANV